MQEERGMTTSFAQLLDDAARRFGPRTAFEVDGRELTFVELADVSRLVGAELMQRGIRAGDQVVVWSNTSVDFVLVALAAALRGVTLVPISTRYRRGELRHAMAVASPRAVLVGEGLLSSELGRDLGATATTYCLEELTADARSRPLEEPATGQVPAGEPGDFVAQCQFTSGTTSRPKLVQLTASTIMAAADAILRERLEIGPEDRFFSPAPLYHAGGSVLVLLAPLVTGCTVHARSRFDAEEALAQMGAIDATITLGHQPHFVDYMAQQRRVPTSLRGAIVIANPAFNRVVQDYLSPAWLVSPYGLTETAAAGTCARWDDDASVRLGTVGRALPGLEVSLAGTDNAAASAEVLVRGWAVSPGYVGLGSLTDDDGWYHTGDLGRLDRAGNLELLGRVKEIVRVGGENVSPVEVETTLMSHPEVLQAVVFGVPDPRLGEVCAAAVETSPGSTVGPDDLRAWCAGSLASFKVPRSYTFLTDWPKTSSGKVARAEVRSSVVNPQKSATKEEEACRSL